VKELLLVLEFYFGCTILTFEGKHEEPLAHVTAVEEDVVLLPSFPLPQATIIAKIIRLIINLIVFIANLPF